MQNLIPLVKSLKKSEISFIQHYYKNDTDKKRLKLFNWVLEEKVTTDEVAAEKLYGGKCSAYSHLKTRLINDLMNLLLFEEGTRQSQSERFQNEAEVLRKILIGKILLVRKIDNLGVKQLREAIDTANEFELYTEKIIAKDILSLKLGNTYGIESYNETLSGLENDLNVLQNLFLAKQLYYGVALPNSFLKNNEKEFLRVSQIASSKLKQIYSETQSPNIGYYYMLTAINYYTIIKDYENLYQVSNEFLELVNSVRALYSRVNMVNAFMQIYSASVYLNKIDEAIENAKSALNFTNKNGPNELLVLEFLVLALFQSDNIKIISQYLNIGLNHPRVSVSKFSEGKWIFYNSAYFFKNKDFNKALIELRKENELLKDKSGWLFGHKLLEIMCYVELEEFDMIDFRIESLRKLLLRQKHKNIIRIKSIFNILNTLVKTGYNFKNTYKKEAQFFQLLNESKDEYFWDPLGYEIIRFDEWFKSKI